MQCPPWSVITAAYVIFAFHALRAHRLTQRVAPHNINTLTRKPMRGNFDRQRREFPAAFRGGYHGDRSAGAYPSQTHTAGSAASGSRDRSNRGASKTVAMPVPENTPSLRSEQTRASAASLPSSLAPSRGSISPHDTSEPVSRTASADPPARLSGWGGGVPDSVRDGGGPQSTPIVSSDGHAHHASLAFDKSLSWGDSVDDEPVHRKLTADRLSHKEPLSDVSPKPVKPDVGSPRQKKRDEPELDFGKFRRDSPPPQVAPAQAPKQTNAWSQPLVAKKQLYNPQSGGFDDSGAPTSQPSHIAKRGGPASSTEFAYYPEQHSYRDSVLDALYGPWMAYPNLANMTEEEIEARRLQRASQRKTRSIGIKYARAPDGVSIVNVDTGAVVWSPPAPAPIPAPAPAPVPASAPSPVVIEKRPPGLEHPRRATKPQDRPPVVKMSPVLGPTSPQEHGHGRAVHPSLTSDDWRQPVPHKHTSAVDWSPPRNLQIMAKPAVPPQPPKPQISPQLEASSEPHVVVLLPSATGVIGGRPKREHTRLPVALDESSDDDGGYSALKPAAAVEKNARGVGIVREAGSPPSVVLAPQTTHATPKTHHQDGGVDDHLVKKGRGTFHAPHSGKQQGSHDKKLSKSYIWRPTKPSEP